MRFLNGFRYSPDSLPARKLNFLAVTATVKTLTSAAPAFLRAAESTSIVEPVVITSSTSRTLLPATADLSSTRKLPSRFLLLSSRVSPTCLAAPSFLETTPSPRDKPALIVTSASFALFRHRHVKHYIRLISALYKLFESFFG